MASRFYKYDKDKKKIVEFFPGKPNFSDGAISNHINMRTTWSGQTQVEFSQTTMDQDIAERNKR